MTATQCSPGAQGATHAYPPAPEFGLSKKHKRWKELIKVHGKRKELDSFTTEEGCCALLHCHAELAWGAR